jgi:peptidoglycan-associated lipoprotein
MRKLSLYLVVSALAACGSQAKKETTPPVTKQTPAGEAKPQEPVKAEITPVDSGALPPKDPIYFDYDSAQLAAEASATLQKVADYLEKHPGSTVTVSGHTDERGTTEYNLALGDQRAKAAHDYLVRLGVDPSRVKTISYGKERPAAQGHGEEAWSKNRRDEFDTATK